MNHRSIASGLALIGAACAAQAADYTTETLVFRELSVRTFSGSFNDEKDHPVLQVDDTSNPKPIGPGRGAGTWVFLNNKLVDYKTGAEAGLMRGVCWTIDHGPNGPWKGPVTIGAGGPYHSACQFTYVLKDGQIVANGDMDMNQMEKDTPLGMAITGGTGRYRAASGEVTVQQDPPGQPITYKVQLSVDVRAPSKAAAPAKKKSG